MKIWWDELNWDLKALALLVSPSKKFRKMLAIEKKLKKLKILLKLKNVKWFKDFNNHYYKHVVQRKEFNFKTAQEYKKAAIDFMKNKEGKDYMVWVRKDDGNIFKLNKKTWYGWIIDKKWNIRTYHRMDDYLKNPENYINKNK